MKNSKTIKILSLIALFLAIVFAWILINDHRSKKLSQMPQSTGLENPFGSSSEGKDLPGDQTEGGDQTTSPQTQGPSEIIQAENVTIIHDNPALKQLAEEAVAGFTFTSEDRVVKQLEVPADSGIVEVYDFSGYKTHRFGDKSDDITKIKTVLNRQDVSPNLVVGTEYDIDMKNAVVEFQNTHGLSGDGVIGPKTYAELNKLQGIDTFSTTAKPDNIETVEMVRYVDMTSGLIYDEALRKKEDKKAVTKKTIPPVAEAMFDSTAKRVIFRYLEKGVIQTYLATLDFPTIDPDLPQEELDKIDKTATLDGEFLPEGISYADVSDDGKTLFYLNPIGNGVSGISYNFATGARKELWQTPFTEWIAQFAGDSKVNMTTKASAEASGFSYTLDNKTGAFSRNTGGELGLTTLLSPNGKKMLYATSAGGTISTYLLDIASGNTDEISPSALPEKCVFTSDSSEIYCAAAMKLGLGATYPDDWYKGKTSFEDALWKIDVETAVGNIIYDIYGKDRESIDAINLQLNPGEDYLGFINKKDGTLWGFDLNK